MTTLRDYLMISKISNMFHLFTNTSNHKFNIKTRINIWPETPYFPIKRTLQCVMASLGTHDLANEFWTRIVSTDKQLCGSHTRRINPANKEATWQNKNGHDLLDDLL